MFSVDSFSKYIDVPYEEFGRSIYGMDCLGLLIAIYADAGIKIPDYAYESPEDINNNEFIFNDQWDTGNWYKVDTPMLGDVVIFNIVGHPVHIGIALDRKHFIHAHRSSDVGIEKFNSIKWKNRIHGFYRHNDSVSMQN